MPAYKEKGKQTWEVSFSIKDPVTGKYKKKHKRNFPTKRDALLWELDQKANAPAFTDVSFFDMEQQWLQYRNPPKQSTVIQETTRVNKYMADFKDKPISRIKKSDLMQWQLWLNDQELSNSVKNFCIRVVKGTFRFANNFYDIPNPSNTLKSYKREKRVKDFETWTPAEFNQFIQHVELREYRNCYTFMYWTGCRRGEALALCYTDIKNSKAHIWHQIKYFEDGFFSLKTDSSERTIPLPGHLMKLLKPIIKECDEQHPFLFGGERSLPITNLQRNFTKAIKASGVKKIRLHDLRHSFATNCINNGVNFVAVSRYLGHSNIQQTLDTYTHLIEKTSSEMVKQVDLLMEKAE